MKRINQALIALVVISATCFLAMPRSYGQSRPRIVGKPTPKVVIVESRPRRANNPPRRTMSEKEAAKKFDQFLNRLQRLTQTYIESTNR